MSSNNNKLKIKNALGNQLDVGWAHGIKVDNNPRKIKCILELLYHYICL